MSANAPATDVSAAMCAMNASHGSDGVRPVVRGSLMRVTGLGMEIIECVGRS